MKTLRFILPLLLVALLLSACAATPYSKAIYNNWGIDIHTDYAPVFHTERVVGVQGDGVRYTVYEYDSFEVLQNSLDWLAGPGEGLNNGLDEYFKDAIAYAEFDVAAEDLPQWRKPYHFHLQNRDDQSSICLVYGNEENRLYILEIFV